MKNVGVPLQAPNFLEYGRTLGDGLAEMCPVLCDVIQGNYEKKAKDFNKIHPLMTWLMIDGKTTPQA